MSTVVYLLQHVRPDQSGHEDIKLLGVFSSEQNALSAIGQYQNLPGFINHPQINDHTQSFPQGFYIDAYELDKKEWPEGFVSV